MAQTDKIFLDTNIALDHLAARQPFAEYAHRIFGLAEKGEISISIASLSFTNLYYILRKLNGHAEAIALLAKLKVLVHVTAVGQAEIQLALGSNFKDFEDAVQYFAAKAEGEITTSPATRTTSKVARSRCCLRMNISQRGNLRRKTVRS